MLKRITRIWDCSLCRQLILGIALVHAILMTIFVFDLVIRQRNFLQEQSISNTLSLTQTLAGNAVSWVLARDVIGLEEVIQSQSQFPDLQYAMILSPNGEVIGHNDRTKVGLYIDDPVSSTLLKAEPVPQYLVLNQDLIDISSPILANDQLIGWARVGISQDKINAGLKDIIRDGIGYTIFAIVVGSIFALLMARSLTRGIQHLVVVADKIHQGDETVRSTLKRKDEIGQLSDTVNMMIDTLIDQKNITLKVQQDQQLTLAEYGQIVEQLKLVINGANLGTWDWQVNSGAVMFNSRWAEIIGYDIESIPPHISSWENFLHPDESKDVKRCLTSHLEGITSVYMTEHRLRHKSGQWVWVLAVGKVLERDQTGKPTRVVGIHMDITRSKELEYQLMKARDIAESANRAKSVFLANMSHELRTPLNAILGYAEIFTNDSSLTAEQQRKMKTIRQSGDHLLLLINDILDVSKIEEDKMALVTTPINLQNFIGDICNIIQIKADLKDIAFNYVPAEPLPRVIEVDELRLRQVLLNLLANSIKFTSHGYCTLSISGAPFPDNRVNLTFIVDDSGVGVAPELQGKVFKPFHQAGERLKYSEGSGLGLTISQKLIQLMGGELTLQSPLNQHPLDKEGVGCRFTFTIEVPTLSESTIHPAQAQSVTGYDLGQKDDGLKRILIVDDDPANRAVLRDTLEPLGFLTQEAEDGSTIVNDCLRHEPDLILMDLQMPRVDGFAALALLKAHPDCQHLPVIAVTAAASAGRHLHKQCLDQGFDDFFTKPFSTTALLEAMAHLLNITLHYVPSPQPHQADRTQDITPPSQEVLRALIAMTQTGDITSIKNLLHVLAGEPSGNGQAFMTHLEELVHDLKLMEIEQFVSRYIQE